MTELPKELIAKDVAFLCDLTKGRVSQRIKEGKFKTNKKTGKLPITSIPEYIREIRDNEKESTEIGRRIEEEKLRKLKRENDVEEKKFAPVELFQVAIERVVSVQIPILESLPLIMKRNWPEITGDQITLVKKAIAECRNAIADTRIDF